MLMKCPNVPLHFTKCICVEGGGGGGEGIDNLHVDDMMQVELSGRRDEVLLGYTGVTRSLGGGVMREDDI